MASWLADSKPGNQNVTGYKHIQNVILYTGSSFSSRRDPSPPPTQLRVHYEQRRVSGEPGEAMCGVSRAVLGLLIDFQAWSRNIVQGLLCIACQQFPQPPPLSLQDRLPASPWKQPQAEELTSRGFLTDSNVHWSAHTRAPPGHKYITQYITTQSRREFNLLSWNSTICSTLLLYWIYFSLFFFFFSLWSHKGFQTNKHANTPSALC